MNKINFKDSKALFKFFNPLWLKLSIFSLLFSLIVPIVMSIVTPSVTQITVIVMMPIIQCSFFALPQIILNFKKNSVIKRISITRVNKETMFFTFIMTSALWQIILCILSLCIYILFSSLNISNVWDPFDFQNIQWSTIIFQVILVSFFMSTLGIFLGFLFKNTTSLFVVSIVVAALLIVFSENVFFAHNPSMSKAISITKWITPWNIAVTGLSNSAMGIGDPIVQGISMPVTFFSTVFSIFIMVKYLNVNNR